MVRIPVILLSLAVLATPSVAAASTIASTAAGGTWFDTTTWIGGVVPGADDDVVLYGPVTVAGEAACHDLDIHFTGSLEGELVAPPRSLHVTGALTNAGAIGVNDPFWLDLQIDGDLHNSGIWAVTQTTLTGTADRTVSQQAGADYTTALVAATGAAGDITVTTPLAVTGNIDIAGCRLVLQPDCPLTLDSGFFRGEMLAGGNEMHFASWAYLQQCTIDDVVLVGSARASSGVTVTTRLEVRDHLQNGGTGGGGGVLVDGDLVNHGVITFQNYSFLLRVTGDVENHGEISTPQLELLGTGVTHHLTSGPDAVISADVFLPEFQAATLVLETPAHFAGSLGIGVGTLILEPGATLTFSDFGGMGTGTVLANDNAITTVGNASISNLTVDRGVLDDVVIFGENHFTGGLTVTGAVASWPWADAELVVEGLLHNQGAISDGDHPVRVRALGDLQNDGTFTNTRVSVAGTVDQAVGAGSEGIDAIEFVLESELAGASYQWYRDGEPLPGENGAHLALPGVGPVDYGTYHCEVDGVASRSIVIAETIETTDVPAAGLAALAQNRPNPFNPATEIAFHLDREARVSLVVYDLAGRQVASLVDRELPAGPHRVPWQPRNLASGTYVYRLRAGDVDLARKCTLLK